MIANDYRDLLTHLVGQRIVRIGGDPAQESIPSEPCFDVMAGLKFDEKAMVPDKMYLVNKIIPVPIYNAMFVISFCGAIVPMLIVYCSGSLPSVRIEGAVEASSRSAGMQA